jgi:hypothetical protein
MRLVRWVLVMVLVWSSALGVIGADDEGSTANAAPVTSAYVAGNFCLTRNSPDQYASMFDGEPGGVIGADYQRAHRMPNGNVLWTFQDAEIRLPDGTSTLVHNIGMIQSGTCFSVLVGGAPHAPQPWLFASQTTPFQRWYWPLDATLGNDGRMYVYVAEMVEHGDHYLDHVEPVSTAVAAIDVDTGVVVSQRAARNATPALYGFAAASDDRWTYLYAQCHRQFGFDLEMHDFSCSAEVTVARVPTGQLFAAPRYWTGSGWSSRADRAAPVLPTAGRHVNALDITLVGNRWLSIVKVDDWFGDTIIVESATRPVGPFETIMTLPATPKCDPAVCNTYYASWIPDGPAGTLTIGLSNNRWDGILPHVYRPSYRTIPTPRFVLSPADRCSLGYCS